ncbi:MAG: hypothetical protein ACFE95_09940 [Candidatus Hodarchaeota archaeon]
MSETEIEVVYDLIARNPPIFAIIGGVILVLFGELVKIEALVSSGWSSLITGIFLQIGWYVMINSRRKRR